jgi:hypothetical protein
VAALSFDGATMKRLYLFAAAAPFLAGCASHVAPTRPTAHATAGIVAQKAGPDDLYPNPQLTPGAMNSDVTQDNIHQTICVSGWTATVRPPAAYTNRLKTEGITQYRYNDPSLKDYEEDHFIPLELGGNSRDPNNLWPEPYGTKVEGKTMGAHQKDKVEDLLKMQVCDGTITLKAAQDQIASDWYKIYLANF